MRTKLVTVALVGALGLTGTALLAPGSALAQTADGTPRLTALKDALKGLVSDGTLTQSQADEVATTLAEQLPGHGPHGRGPGGPGGLAREEVAKALGISVEELRTQREAGRTLAQIAEAEGIARAELVKRLVTAAEQRLAEAVEAGRLTRARADELSAGLEARISELVDRVGHGPGGRHGQGGHGQGGHGQGGHGQGPQGRSPSPGAADPTPAPSPR